MKDYHDIISRFENVQSPPISEEMFGAYLEGNLDCHEMESISRLVQENDLLRTISEDMIYNSTEPDPVDELLDVGMVNDAVSFPINHDNPVEASYNMMESKEYIVDHESYIEDYDSIENDAVIGDDLFDDTSFELPEIPF